MIRNRALLRSGLGLVSSIVSCLLLFAPPAFANPIKIGVIAPLTGPAASMGQGMQKVLSLIEDPELELLYQDDQCTAQKALTAYQVLKTKGVKVFVVNCSGSILAMAPLALKNGDLIITGYAGSAEIRKTGPEVVRFDADAISVADEMARTLSKDPSKRYALLYEDQDYAESLAKTLLQKMGSQIPVREHYLPTDGSFKSQLLRLSRPEIDAVIMIPTSDQAASVIYKEYAELHIDKPLIGEVNLCDYAINPRAFGIHGYCWKSTLESPGMTAFLKAYKDKFGDAPQYPVNDAISYDAVWVVSRLMHSDGGSLSPPEIASTLIKGVKGSLRDYEFEPNGEVIPREFLVIRDY